MRIEITLIPPDVFAPLQPGHSASVVALLDQVSADIVIRVAEVRVNLDRPMAFVNRLVDHSHKIIGPSEEGVGFGSGKCFNRSFIERHRLIEIAAFLSLVSLLEMPQGLNL